MLLLGFSWFLVGCFVMFQYYREKQYKIDKLDGQLQIFNTHLIDALDTDSIDFLATISAQRLPLPGLRISVINTDGSLVFDNTLDKLPAESHLGRHEIKEAIANGSGRTIRRHSASTDDTYFYSATSTPDIIVRSAVPYSLSLQEILRGRPFVPVVHARHDPVREPRGIFRHTAAGTYYHAPQPLRSQGREGGTHI